VSDSSGRDETTGSDVGPRGMITPDREHQRALYAFGGGGSGAAMRLSGWAEWKEGAI